MNSRVFFNAIVNGTFSIEVEDGGEVKEMSYSTVEGGDINELLIEYAKAELEKLDKRKEAKKSQKTKTQTENDSIKEKIVELLNEDKENIFTAKDIAEALELSSSQKATALLKQIVESGEAISVDTKSGSRKVKGYKAV